MLHASRGIPAWCQKELPLLIVATGLAEGTGLYLVIAQPSAVMIAAALLAGILREIVREAYRRGLILAKVPVGTLAWFSLPAENVLSAGAVCLDHIPGACAYRVANGAPRRGVGRGDGLGL